MWKCFKLQINQICSLKHFHTPSIHATTSCFYDSYIYFIITGNKLQQYLCSCRKPEQRHYDHEDETPLIGINALNDLNPITTTPDDTPAAEYGTSITEDSTEGNHHSGTDIAWVLSYEHS